MGRESEREEARLKQLIEECKVTVINQVIGPFGLSTAMFDDKDGGNVTTVHNAKNGIFAEEEDRTNFASYGQGYRRELWEDSSAEQMHRQIDKLLDQGQIVQDRYRNEPVLKGQYEIDHITPLRQMHEERSLHLYFDEQGRKDLANAEWNLAATDHSLNSAKGKKKNNEFILDRDAVEEHNASRLKMRVEQIRSETLIAAKTTAEVGRRVVVSGTREGFQMGFRQALGTLLCELIVAIFDEATDMLRHGFQGDSPDKKFFEVLKGRIARVVDRILSKWKDVVASFRNGVLGGFFSNFVTFIINAVVTTQAKLVRVIREGFQSLVRAFKIIFFPPEGMTVAEAIREATKLVVSVIMMGLGVLIEEAVMAFVSSIPGIGQLAAIIAPVVVGILTGLATAIAIYLIDRVFDALENPYSWRMFEQLESNLTLQTEIGMRLGEIAMTYDQIAAGYAQMVSTGQEMVQKRECLAKRRDQTMDGQKEMIYRNEESIEEARESIMALQRKLEKLENGGEKD